MAIYDTVDIDVTKVDAKSVFALDTNVLFWTHYSKASHPSLKVLPYQVKKYPDFVGKLLEHGNTVVTTLLNLTELVGVVERNEYRIYKAVTGNKIGFKVFRGLEQEREKYKREIDQMMMEIEASYDGKISIIDVSKEKFEGFKKNISNIRCDVFDYFIIEELKSKGICDYISDDRDFSFVKDINLYCAQK